MPSRPVLARHHVLGDDGSFVGIVRKYADREWTAALIDSDMHSTIETSEHKTMRDATTWLVAHHRRNKGAA